MELEAGDPGAPEDHAVQVPAEDAQPVEELGVLDVEAGQAITTRAGEWVQYSTPDPDGAEYVAVCLPAFSPDTVHRDEP